MVNVILAGGSGTRLWPLSRESRPKQFLDLFDGKTLFELTCLRNSAFTKEALVVTSETLWPMAKEQCEGVFEKLEAILEPIGRDSAAAIALAAFARPNDILFVTPSDHYIPQQQGYKEAIERGVELAQQGALVTFGITPTHPHTGYGYIQAEGEDVLRFLEKPPLEQAQRFVQEGYLWNSGMFLFAAKSFLEELQKHRPDIYEAAQRTFIEAQKVEERYYLPRALMEQIPATSVDYAVMERSDRLKVVRGDFEWSDVGSFDALKELVKSEDALLYKSENIHIFASSRQIVCNEVEDLFIVDTPTALLVSKQGASQNVKEIVKILRQTNPKVVQEARKVYRPWGSYETLVEGENFKVKLIEVKPHRRLSLQRHKFRSEHWVVVSGVAHVQICQEVRELHPNQSTYVPVGAVHRLENRGEEPLIIIETQVGSYVGEDDIERLEDDFGRDR